MSKNNINTDLLDKLAREEGKEIKKEDFVTKEGEELSEFVNESLEKVREVPKLAYGGTDGPVPGENITDRLDALRNVNSEGAAERLVMQTALVKAKNENAPVLTPEEKRLKRQQTVQQILIEAEEAYYVEHHYVMDGRTRRRTRAMIERNYDKGVYNRKPKSKLNGE